MRVHNLDLDFYCPFIAAVVPKRRLEEWFSSVLFMRCIMQSILCLCLFSFTFFMEGSPVGLSFLSMKRLNLSLFDPHPWTTLEEVEYG